MVGMHENPLVVLWYNGGMGQPPDVGVVMKCGQFIVTREPSLVCEACGRKTAVLQRLSRWSPMPPVSLGCCMRCTREMTGTTHLRLGAEVSGDGCEYVFDFVTPAAYRVDPGDGKTLVRIA